MVSRITPIAGWAYVLSSELNFYALENVCWKLLLVTQVSALLLEEDDWEFCKVGHWVLPM